MYILYISSFKSSMKGKLIYSGRDQVIGCLRLWGVLPVKGHKVRWRKYLTFWSLWWIHRCENVPKLLKLVLTGLLWWSSVKNLPANAGDAGPAPRLGRWHTPPGSRAHEPQRLKPVPQSPCSAPEKHRSEKPVHFSWRGASARHSQRKPDHSDQDPVRPVNK